MPSNCKLCRKEDEADDMVECNACEGWFHYSCVGLKEAPAEEEEFHCMNCKIQVLTQKLDGMNTAVSEVNKISAMLENIMGALNSKQQSTSTTTVHVTPTTPSQLNVSEVKPKIESAPLEKLLARQTIQDLPSFDGNPLDWPKFKNIYERTTELGCFSDIENLVRLEKALKGEALMMVKSLFFDPNGVKEIFATLENQYGQPQKVINALIKDLLKTKSQKDGPNNLVVFAQKLKNVVCNIKSVAMPQYLFQPILIKDLVEKLSISLQYKWSEYTIKKADTNLEDFSNWVNEQSQIYSLVFKDVKSKEYVNSHYEEKTKCTLCKKDLHKLFECGAFKNMNVNKRWKYVNENKLCMCCLNKRNHRIKECRNYKICNINGCKYSHHELLHEIRQIANPNAVASTGSQNLSSNAEPSANAEILGVNQHKHPRGNRIIYRIIPITLHNRDKQVDTFAFLDDGSSCTLLDDTVAKELSLVGQKEPLCLKWTNESTNIDENSIRTSVRISARNSKQKYHLLNVRTVNNLKLPQQSLNVSQLKSKYTHLESLNVESYVDAQPILIIGLQHAKLLASTEIREGKFDEPVAAKTKLGWCIYGRISTTLERQNDYSFTICECQQEISQLNNTMKTYFEVENVGVKNPEKELKTEDEERAVKVVENTIRKVSDSKYEIGLLWKNDNVKLPNSYPNAMKRLLCVENKLNRDLKLKEWYTKTIDEYLKKGYLRKATSNDLQLRTTRTWYLPHFAICNNNKNPPKYRLVFDAAAKVNGVSLNSQLLPGPNLVSSLLNILFSFREKRIGIAADIEEMFLQVNIVPEDQQSQRILWRNCEDNKKPDVYIMQVMTFGATCSPFSATAIKNHNAVKFTKEYPDAVDAIINKHYVDDFINSYDTVEETIKMSNQVIEIHKTAGFKLRNFMSNNSTVMNSLPAKKLNTKIVDVDKNSESEKMLGLCWDIDDDAFMFKIKKNAIPTDVAQGLRNITKREALSFTMKIFDPLGFISFITIRGKIIIQEMWNEEKEWDTPVSENIHIKFIKWLRELTLLNNIKIPRCHFTNLTKEQRDVELHIFVDASEHAYSAVAYFRIIKPEIQVSLIGSKAKVTPKKPLSIPRKELVAALIGTRLSNTIIKGYATYKIKKITYWSDSKVVLAWLRSKSKKYQQFVSLRVNEILESTDVTEWRYVPSKLNVADDATRNNGSNNEERWFKGPNYLWHEENEWPQDENIELNELVMMMNNSHVCNLSFNFIDVTKFSNWNRLKRTVAYVLRFIKMKIYKKQPATCYLSLAELSEAENILFKKAQLEEFEEDFNQLLKNKPITKQSKLFKLTPILDENNIIRLDGRLYNAEVSREIKQPIILPKNHYVTFLIVKHYHEMLKHYNQEAIVANVRKRFWVISCRTVTRTVKAKCQQCKNKSVKPTTPQMGQIPIYKFAIYQKPFTYTGVDLFGPFNVQITRRVASKRYGCIFVCMTSGAVHLEMVTDMSADSFIRALRNFVNRRGPITKFISDNGTNFHAAVKELNCSIESLGEMATNLQISWDFIPPNSPNFGGQWERLIQSVKKVLFELLKSNKPQEDILRSSLIEVENIINSRPLTHVPIEPSDTQPITPNDILKGVPHPALTPGIFGEKEYIYRRQWRVSQQFANSFWKRWIESYLPELIKRPKWCQPAKPVQVGDVVLIIESNELRSTYKKGIVIKTYKGRDGIIRVAKVRTSSGELKRPVSKLAVLDVQPQVQDRTLGEDVVNTTNMRLIKVNVN